MVCISIAANSCRPGFVLFFFFFFFFLSNTEISIQSRITTVVSSMQAKAVLVCLQPELQRRSPCRRACLPADGEVLAQSGFDSCTEATLLLELLPDKPYLVVPSMLTAGNEAPFELRCAPVLALNAPVGGCDRRRQL